ncbi:MAG TPA: hypothetical protein VK735_46445 [Pseudonocardia sp.]|nr:hypothetical protein [Pseudonocardia sp.]
MGEQRDVVEAVPSLGDQTVLEAQHRDALDVQRPAAAGCAEQLVLMCAGQGEAHRDAVAISNQVIRLDPGVGRRGDQRSEEIGDAVAVGSERVGEPVETAAAPRCAAAAADVDRN